MRHLLIVAGVLQLLHAVVVGIQIVFEGDFRMSSVAAPLLLLAAGGAAIQVYTRKEGHLALYIVNIILLMLTAMILGLGNFAEQSLLAKALVAGLAVPPIMAMVGAAFVKKQPAATPAAPPDEA